MTENRAMVTTAAIPLEQYLSTSYRPDCDYSDGMIEERNAGERDHSLLQAALAACFFARRKEFGLHVFTEQRLRLNKTRVRIPDVCVTLGPKPPEVVLVSPPFLCIEILSPEDRMNRIQQRMDDYLRFGVPHVWLIDPQSRRAWRYTTAGNFEALDGVLRTSEPEIVISLPDLFASVE